MRKVIDLLKSILRPVEYKGPLRIRRSFKSKYTVLDADDQPLFETYDEQWVKDCVNWYNSRVAAGDDICILCGHFKSHHQSTGCTWSTSCSCTKSWGN